MTLVGPAAAQSQRWHDGLSFETFSATLNEDEQRQYEQSLKSFDTTKVKGSNATLDVGFFDDTSAGVPANSNSAFTGIRLRLSIDGR